MAKKAKKKDVKKKDTKGATKKRVYYKRNKTKGTRFGGSGAAVAPKQAKSKQTKAKQSKTASKVKAKSKAKGLVLSAAQWRAYDAAYTAVEKSGHAQLNAKIKGQYASEALANRRAALAAAAQSLRKYRLGAASSIQKKAAAAQSAASTSSIAAYAVKQSLRQASLAHQNAALQNRVYADFEQHMTILGRKQFAAAGEKKYATDAVMRTLTTKAATTIEQARFARAVKTAKRAVKSTTARSAASKAFSASISAEVKAADAVINANAKAAALKAAYAIPAPRKARRPSQVPAGTYGHWFGDPGGEDCAAAAVANSLRFQAERQLSREQYRVLTEVIPVGSTVAEALDTVMNRWPELGGYDGTWHPRELVPGMIVCFPTEEGPHAALLLEDGKIASWGEVLPLEDAATGEIEEAYEPFWRRIS
jgi:hypothetical protein